MLLSSARRASHEMRSWAEPTGSGKTPGREFTQALSTTPNGSDDGSGSGMPNPVYVLDDQEFSDMNDAMRAYDENRDIIIKRSRDIAKAAKSAVYCLHRSDFPGGHKQLVHCESIMSDLSPILKSEPTLRVGCYSAAMEEYCEAALFRNFLQNGTLLPRRHLPHVDKEEYLGGAVDFTGELNRFAVARATKRDIRAVNHCREIVDALYGQMVQFDFRNGHLRKKFDTLKYTLKRLENLLYDLSLTRHGASEEFVAGPVEGEHEGPRSVDDSRDGDDQNTDT